MHNKEESSEIIFVQAKRKRKKSALKGLILLLLIAVCVVVAFNFSKIKEYLAEGLTTDDVPTKEDSDTDLNSSMNNTTDTSPPQDTVPKDCYEFIEVTKHFEQLTNDASLEIGALEYEQIKASEIYKKYGNDAPVALIIHSSALEGYSNGKYYSQNDEFYSRNNNVSKIGEIICNELISKGVNAIHIDSSFANGGIYSSTQEYENAINQALKKYPSIEYVFDISRGIKINSDLTMERPIALINSLNMAQIRITVGSDANDKFWERNLSLALKIATENNDIVSDVTLCPFSLSQELSPTCLQVDIGDYSNTFEEASLVAIELSSRLASLIG